MAIFSFPHFPPRLIAHAKKKAASALAHFEEALAANRNVIELPDPEPGQALVSHRFH